MSQLIYDADCGFCTRSARWGERHLGTRTPVRVISSRDADLAALGVPAERANQEVLLAADGRVFGGAEAIARWLGTGPGWARALGGVMRLPGIKQLARPVYRMVARHRHQLPGGTAACEMPRPATKTKP